MTMSRLRRVAHDESGLTLTELLVTILLLGLVLSATLSVLDTNVRSAPRDDERAIAITEAQTGLNGMVRELRQAYSVQGWTSDSIRVLVRRRRDDPATPAVEYATLDVQYSCGSENPGRCTRREAPAGSPLPATGKPVILRVLNGDPSLPAARRVFNFDQSSDRSNAASAGAILPSYVTVRVEVPAAGERREGYSNSVVLEDGFYARNVPISQ
ncbi:MAG: prepilin-type N-terminal cleavage/methylation domain-containing protein [Actinomycetota bacterium]|nr:prepilin-type N-terminal cleavage/methylation domain-containing protein [Actinomycetota bacterium]